MIYIGIPVHNERHTIGPLLWRIRELLYGEQREFHVLVCDDASDDGTSEALERYPRVLPLTLLHNERCQGYAASLERIVREAVRRSDYHKRDALVTMQADFSDAPEALSDLLRTFEGGADLVTLAAAGPASREHRTTRALGRLIARSLVLPETNADPFASLRLYRLFTLGRALQALDDSEPLLRHRGWAANAELLLRALPWVRRVEVVEHPARPPRRYRESRFDAVGQLRALRRAGRDPRLRAIRREVRQALAS